MMKGAIPIIGFNDTNNRDVYAQQNMRVVTAELEDANSEIERLQNELDDMTADRQRAVHQEVRSPSALPAAPPSDRPRDAYEFHRSTTSSSKPPQTLCIPPTGSGEGQVG